MGWVWQLNAREIVVHGSLKRGTFIYLLRPESGIENCYFCYTILLFYIINGQNGMRRLRFGQFLLWGESSSPWDRRVLLGSHFASVSWVSRGPCSWAAVRGIGTTIGIFWIWVCMEPCRPSLFDTTSVHVAEDCWYSLGAREGGLKTGESAPGGGDLALREASGFQCWLSHCFDCSVGWWVWIWIVKICFCVAMVCSKLFWCELFLYKRY